MESESADDVEGLSMEAKATEAPSSDVAALWADIGADAPAAPVDKETLRIDDLKRKYQNAIGRLPYGIPSPALRDMDWVDLASALATGEKRTVEGGKETTSIDGRWYYSDHEDTGTFLKEHGAKPKGSATRSDKQDLLSKLEERFILGEISEESYRELKEKFSK